ncbi:unnamed protein product [Porites evermanni]|uniref:Uncharacterized protein n=1 Tax=Porites evermanni TaxID=104178 RepID=A0ABN8M092_9CNID|nr:unnamed protein product [Porites evermanni]
MAAKAEIISATRALRPLRNRVDNFILFESEVEKMISRLFEKYRSNQNSIERVRNSLLEVGLVIEQEVMLWLKKLHRRLSPRKKARDPWTKARSSYGVTHSESRRSDCIVYTEENRLIRDLSRLCDVSRNAVMGYFSKQWKGARKGEARVTVTASKPFTISYFKRESYVLMKCHYQYINEFGYTFES